MTKTTNYQLPQWEATDPLRREDFNGAMESIDAALGAMQEVTAAAYTPDNKPYVIGSYTGTGANMTITLGFRPSFLIIGGGATTYNPGTHTKWLVVTGGEIFTDSITFTDTGFALTVPSNTNASPYLVESGRKYNYIAFR